MWAQVLNMSVKRERAGIGTILAAGLEELLRRENTDVLLLYPAQNGRAPSFWASLGYSTREDSLLPEEELKPHSEGGPLMPEIDPEGYVPLPRWEKYIGPPLGEDAWAWSDMETVGVKTEHGGHSHGTDCRRGGRPAPGRGRLGGVARGSGRGTSRKAGPAHLQKGSHRTVPASKSRLAGEAFKAAAEDLALAGQQVEDLLSKVQESADAVRV